MISDLVETLASDIESGARTMLFDSPMEISAVNGTDPEYCIQPSGTISQIKDDGLYWPIGLVSSDSYARLASLA